MPAGVTGADILDALPDAVMLIDAEARLSWANPAAGALFGLSVEESIGLSGLDFLHPDDLQVALVSMVSIRGKQVGTPLELRVRSTEGWRLVEILGSNVGDQILLSARDLTDRRRWEIVGDGTARVRSLMQNAASITILMGADGTVGSSSVGLTRQLGIDQEWLEGRSILELVDHEDHPALESALRQVRDPGPSPGPIPGPVTVDLRLRSRVGDAIPFAITFTNLLDDPTVEGIIATGHDVSDRVRTEHDLRTANSVLAATLESTADGILVVGVEGAVTSYNSRFASMWNLPADAMETLDSEHITSLILEQLCDPAAFMIRVRDLDADPDAASRDTIEFVDGRVFERDSLPQRIDGRVVGRVWSFRDTSEHRRLQDELSHQAFHDPLTGLANQALFRGRVSVASARLGRRGGRLAVLFIDLDDFKTVNDSLGHSAGDSLLITVSERISRCIRPGDTAARLGGDEFAVLIDEIVDPGDAEAVGERIIEALSEPVSLSSTRVSAAASIGIAYGTTSIGVDDILRNADLAMYTAKAGGKNCIRIFADEMHEAAVERLDLETHLRGAAEREELLVHYQPIVDLSTGRIHAMEALVRWSHPSRGLLGPMSFIPFAEEGGLIEEIGNHVLVTACEEAVRWQRSVGPDLAPAISVNISPRQLGDASLPDRVELLLHRSGLHPAQLILEITESALMTDPVAAAESLERLSRLGVRLAIDDFGTGYSSLAYLQRFPINVLKIDGAFVGDDLAQPGWSLAEAIVQIAHALGMVAVAEGVETQAQADALAEFGCNLAQGYHYSRPVDASAARTLVLDAAANILP